MRLAGYEIRGVSKRFYWIAGTITILILAVLYYFIAIKEPAPAPTTLPYGQLQVEDLPQMGSDPSWFQREAKAYGISRLEDDSALTDSYVGNLGLPVRMLVYIPPESQAQPIRPSLYRNEGGWKFTSGLLLDPRKPYTYEYLQSNYQDALLAQPLMIGFPEQEAPATGGEFGQVYELTGMLWWNSFAFNPPAGEEAGQVASSSPIILVPPGATPRPINGIELDAPTTHRADLQLHMEEDNISVNVRNIEWSAGNDNGLRACVTIKNIGTGPRSAWAGLDGMRAQIGEGTTEYMGSPQPPLTSQESLAAGSVRSGYIVFEGATPSSAPTQDLILRMPLPDAESGTAPESSSQIVTTVISPEDAQWTDVTSDKAEEAVGSGCDSAEASSSSSSSSSTSGSSEGSTSDQLLPDDSYLE